MSLFQQGNFILSSGLKSDFKIDCDYLTDEDIECCAYLLAQKVKPFKYVEPIPSGGIRLANALDDYVDDSVERVLLVDDVYTTGASMEAYKGSETFSGLEVIGAVIFNRSGTAIASWITPLFTMNILG